MSTSVETRASGSRRQQPPCEPREPVAAGTERRQGTDGLVDERREPPPRRLRVARVVGVVEVICVLEGDAEALAERRENRELSRGRARGGAADLDGRPEQGRRLFGVEELEGLDVGGWWLAQIPCLPPDHPAEAGAARQRPHSREERRRAPGAGPRLGEPPEGQRQERVTREDGRRLVEGLVVARAAATDVVVVHGRQIVVDEGVAVHELDGAAGERDVRVERVAARLRLRRREREQG